MDPSWVWRSRANCQKIPRSSWGPQTQADVRFFEAYSFDAIEFAWEDGEGEQNEETGQGCGWWLVGWFATLPAGFLLVCLFSLGGGMGDVINVINVFQVQSPGGFWHLEFLVSTDDAPLDFANFPWSEVSVISTDQGIGRTYVFLIYPSILGNLHIFFGDYLGSFHYKMRPYQIGVI